MPAATPLPDGGFAVGSDAGTVFLLDGHLSVVRTVELPPFTTTSLQPLSDGTIVGSGVDGAVRFDPRTGEVRWQQLDYGEACANLRVIEEAGSVFCGSWLGALTTLDLATGVVTRELIAQNGGGGTLWSARDGTELVSFGGNEAVVARWRLDGSGPITTLGPPGWGAWFLSPDGRHLIAAHTDRPGRAQDPLALTFRRVRCRRTATSSRRSTVCSTRHGSTTTQSFGGVMTDDGARPAHVELAQRSRDTHTVTPSRRSRTRAAFAPGKSRGPPPVPRRRRLGTRFGRSTWRPDCAPNRRSRSTISPGPTSARPATASCWDRRRRDHLRRVERRGTRHGVQLEPARRIHHRRRSAVPRVDRWRAHPLRPRLARTDPDLRRQPRIHPGDQRHRRRLADPHPGW